MNWFSDYKKSLKFPAVEEYIDLVFYRPLAFLIVKAVYNTNIKPDNLTFVAILSGLSAASLYAYGYPWSLKAGALMYGLFIVMDCSDGQLARLKKNGSHIGRIIDGVADYIVVTAVYVGLAIHFYGDENVKASMLVWLIVSGVSVIAQSMLVDFFRTRFLDIVVKRRSTLNDEIAEFKKEYLRLKDDRNKWFERNIIHFYLIYSGLQRTLTPKKLLSGFMDVPHDEYYKKNNVLIRFWVLMGPSASRTTLIVCTLLNRFDIFLWVTIAVFNILAVILMIIQHQVDKSYSTINS